MAKEVSQVFNKMLGKPEEKENKPISLSSDQGKSSSIYSQIIMMFFSFLLQVFFQIISNLLTSSQGESVRSSLEQKVEGFANSTLEELKKTNENTNSTLGKLDQVNENLVNLTNSTLKQSNQAKENAEK